MKKMLLICIVIFILLAGCSVNGPTIPQETAKSYATALPSGQIVPAQSNALMNPSATPVANSDTILYENKQYGFNVSLPVSWNGYKIEEDSWEDQNAKDSQTAESGPIIIIRHPAWTAEKPRQDIPIMVFTLSQWEALQQEQFNVSAAPVGPGELARNSKYVFALPARYNYAFPEGYEDVEQIINSNSIQATENIA